MIQEAGGINLVVLEMQVSESVVTMQELAIIRAKERNSAIVAFYLDKEAGYGFWMHDNGAFQYINYDNNA